MPEPQPWDEQQEGLPRFFFVYCRIYINLQDMGVFLGIELKSMKVDFPFLKGHEKNTLFIIGNGFDLYHGLLSKYKHFCCWLMLNGHEDFVNDMQTVFCQLDGNIDRLWCNFEKALGQYDLNKLYSHYYKSPDDSMGINKWDISANNVADKVQTICDNIHPLMKLWARQIKIDQAEQQFELPKESHYLTFNYTLLLESLYGIPSNQICHIHGNIHDNKLVTGHDLNKDFEILGAKSDEEERAKQRIIRIINNLKKDKKQQYTRYKSFFLSLPSLSHVVVLGHSLSDVDLYYLGQVLSLQRTEKVWHFSLRHNDNRKAIDSFKQKCRQCPQHFVVNEGDAIYL